MCDHSTWEQPYRQYHSCWKMVFRMVNLGDWSFQLVLRYIFILPMYLFQGLSWPSFVIQSHTNHEALSLFLSSMCLNFLIFKLEIAVISSSQNCVDKMSSYVSARDVARAHTVHIWDSRYGIWPWKNKTKQINQRKIKVNDFIFIFRPYLQGLLLPLCAGTTPDKALGYHKWSLK